MESLMTPFTPDRRQMLLATARCAAAIGLAILSGGLLVRRLASGDCRSNLPCEKCRVWRNCELGPAVASRSRYRRTPGA